MDELEVRDLLRRFEPIIRYTRGERFFPMDVEPYVRASSLWMQQLDERPVCLVPMEELTLEKLGQPRAGGFEAVYYLKFIENLNIAEQAAYKFQEVQEGLKRKETEIFHAGLGRLARVGYLSRFLDALFSITLLARGRVPGATAAAAARKYRNLMLQDECYCYYGRIARENGWLILQYWFFYPFNDWRSSFYGVNDHEADWEMVSVYLSRREDGEVQPEWVAYAAHDEYGDQLRRSWEDPALEKVGEHPVVYVGAGSHAGYFQPGEYLAELEIPFLSPVTRVARALQRGWRRLLQQKGEAGRKSWADLTVFKVPFVDYARGDGIEIGPGTGLEWDIAGLLDPPPPWALYYRGLWGLYAQDPVAGEDAPAGPLYQRDGTMRRAWYDPAGWAGLDKVPTRPETLGRVQERLAELQERQAEREQLITEKSRELTGLGVEAVAMRARPHLKQLYEQHQGQIDALSEELNQHRAQWAAGEALAQALRQYGREIGAGQLAPPSSHLTRAHKPASHAELRLNRLAEIWSAISIGLMLVGFVGIVLFAQEYLFLGLGALVSILVLVEAGFRRQLTQLINGLTITLAIVATIVIFYEFFWLILIAAVLLTGSYVTWENLKELRA